MRIQVDEGRGRAGEEPQVEWRGDHGKHQKAGMIILVLLPHWRRAAATPIKAWADHCAAAIAYKVFFLHRWPQVVVDTAPLSSPHGATVKHMWLIDGCICTYPFNLWCFYSRPIYIYFLSCMDKYLYTCCYTCSIKKLPFLYPSNSNPRAQKFVAS